MGYNGSHRSNKLAKIRGVAWLKFNVRNCGDVVIGYVQNKIKKDY